MREKVTSKAAVYRIPKGTELRLVNTTMGPTDQRRTVVRRQGNALVLFDPVRGRESYCGLETGSTVKATPKGFIVMTPPDTHNNRPSALGCEYEFVS